MLKLPRRTDRPKTLFIIAYALAFANLGLIGVDLYQKRISFPQTGLAFLATQPESESAAESSKQSDTSAQSASTDRPKASRASQPLVVKEAETPKGPLTVRDSGQTATAQTPPATAEPGRGGAPREPVASTPPAAAPTGPSAAQPSSPTEPAQTTAPDPAPTTTPAPIASSPQPVPTLPATGTNLDQTTNTLQGAASSTLEPALP